MFFSFLTFKIFCANAQNKPQQKALQSPVFCLLLSLIFGYCTTHMISARVELINGDFTVVSNLEGGAHFREEGCRWTF